MKPKYIKSGLYVKETIITLGLLVELRYSYGYKIRP